MRRGRAAVFLDRDGTVMEDRGYLAEPGQVTLFPDTVAALRRLQERFELFIVTNQSGVAKGLIRLEDAVRVNTHLVAKLAGAGVNIRKVYVCPHQRSDNCECIKPKPYFPREAEREYGIDLARSFVVGDHPSDVMLGANCGARGVYVRTGHGAKHVAELPAGTVIVEGIGAAAEWILRASSGGLGAIRRMPLGSG
jgi:D-glycero-D-manno-heptose 1,7-bisphosphate phosphatase